MFSKAKNITTAFRHIRLFCIVFVVACMVVYCYAVIKRFNLVGRMQEKLYILANGKAIEASPAERRDNIPVEARDHVQMFHHPCFNLVPRGQTNKTAIPQTSYHAD